MSYKAKFRIVLKDRYAQSVGFWGAKYRIVDSTGGVNKTFISNATTDKNGFTVEVTTPTPKSLRLELINLSEGADIYEVPTYNVADSEVKTDTKATVKTVQVEKGFFKMKITDPLGKMLNQFLFNYKVVSKEKDKNGKLIVLKDWSVFKEPGFTDLITVKKNLISFDSSIDVFKALFYTRPYVDVYLRHNVTRLETHKEERIIAFGSDKKFREWRMNQNAVAALTQPKVEKSKGLVSELKFSRSIKILLSLKKGRTYIAKREDNGKLFTFDLKETNAINWQDGQQITFKVPGRYKGKVIITAKGGKENAKVFEVINIGALDAKNYKANEEPKEIKLIKQPIVKSNGGSSQKFNNNEYAQYCIDMGYTGSNKNLSLDDLKDPKKCTDKEFKSIWSSIKETFSFDNTETWWNVSVGVVDATLDVGKRTSIVNRFFIPFFIMLRIGAPHARFIIRNIGNSTGLFFMGFIGARSNFNPSNFMRHSRSILTMRLPAEEMFDFNPKAAVKGSVVGLIVGAGLELQKWLSAEENQKDVTDLLANLTSMVVKTVIGTWVTVLLVSLIASGGPVGVIIAVGLVVGIAVGMLIDAFDDYIDLTGKVRDFFNHMERYSQNTLKNMVDNGNKLLRLDYVLPSNLL